MKNLVLGFLATVIATLVTGCATNKNGALEAVTIGKPYVVRKLMLPEQRMDREPFLARKADSLLEVFTEEDLASMAAVGAHLEVLARRGLIPIRVKEGFIMKEKGRWYIISGPPDTIAPFDYFVVDLEAVR